MDEGGPRQQHAAAGRFGAGLGLAAIYETRGLHDTLGEREGGRVDMLWFHDFYRLHIVVAGNDSKFSYLGSTFLTTNEVRCAGGQAPAYPATVAGIK